MAKFLLFLEAFLNMFKFIRRRRERREAEEAARSARQLELVDLALRGVVDAVKEQNKPLLAALEAQKSSTELIAQWLKTFQLAPGSDEIDSISPLAKASPELSWLEDIAAEEGEEIPPEFRLALQLQQLEEGESSD